MVKFNGEYRRGDSESLRYEVAVQGNGDLRIFDARVYAAGGFRERIEGRLCNVASLSGTALELHVRRCVDGSIEQRLARGA